MEILNRQIEVYPLNNGFIVNGTYYEKIDGIISYMLSKLNDKQVFSYDNLKVNNKEKLIIDLKVIVG